MYGHYDPLGRTFCKFSSCDDPGLRSLDKGILVASAIHCDKFDMWREVRNVRTFHGHFAPKTNCAAVNLIGVILGQLKELELEKRWIESSKRALVGGERVEEMHGHAFFWN